MLGIDKVVLFDFDGVIVDTTEASLEIERINNPQITREERMADFDGNIYDALKTKKDYTYIPDEEYWPLYFERIMKVPPVSGMPGVVKSLSDRYSLVIVSSSLSATIDDYLRTYDLSPYFSRTMGADVHKSKAEKFRMLFEHFGEGVRYIFLTDTLGDLREAERVAIPLPGGSTRVND